MPTPNETTKELMEFALSRAEHEHEDLTDTWKLLDTKAQATTAVAGVFIAAAFVFVRNTSFQVDTVEKWLLSIAIVLLCASVICAVSSMFIRTVKMPLSGEEAHTIVKDILGQPDSELEERLNRLFGDAIRRWSSVNKSINSSLKDKGWLVKSAQVALVGASLTVTMLTLYAIFFAH